MSEKVLKRDAETALVLEENSKRTLVVGKSVDDQSHEQDSSYFRCYQDICVHEEMLEDRVRTMAYRQAILRNYENIHGKVVLDVGAGTGVLSMFCVQAGARKVYSIEASLMAKQANTLVKQNSMQDRIVVIQGKIEEVELPEKVDVIVSEWMGYLMFYESMLPSVIYARDKWLKKGGLMLPTNATLYMSAYSCPEEYKHRLDLWEEASAWYKVNLSGLRPFAWKCIAESPHVCEVTPENVFSHAAPVCQLDLRTASVDDAKGCQSNFRLKCFGHGQVTGFAMWFEVDFPKDVKLSTSPYSPDTHWAQTVLLMSEPQQVEQDNEITGIVCLKQSKSNSRFLDISIDYTVNNHCGKIYCSMDEKG